VSLSTASTVVALKDTLSSAVGDETVILHFDAGTYFGLDDVGTRVWQLLQQPRTVGELLDLIEEEYDVERERCEAAILPFLEDLVTNGLVSVDAPSPA
jgi:hypothetical protein